MFITGGVYKDDNDYTEIPLIMKKELTNIIWNLRRLCLSLQGK